MTTFNDHIDDDIIKNDIDDDVDMDNPFNGVFEWVIHMWSCMKKTINNIAKKLTCSRYVIICFILFYLFKVFTKYMG